MEAVVGEKRVLNSSLWLECAGPLVTLPPVGSLVVYFPQGHSEQVAMSTQKEADRQIPGYPNLPSKLICRLHNVTLHADPENDEVYAQMTLQPVNGEERDRFPSSNVGTEYSRPTIAFSKTLTASDTSTHGGFSIPRRAAEKVFPPLDYSKQPPAQEIVAKDLHNNEWHFRHIYRGQPRRHLLTTGWSVFVSAKRLQAGDTVLFMRDEKGDLLLGIRRANRQQQVMSSSLLPSGSMLIGVLAAAAHATATNSRFHISFNPRASPSEFVIPLAKYKKALYQTQVSVGMRFRMELETEDSSTRKYMGTITGIGDLDPVNWPNSDWRSLKVGWDESTASQRQRRVSLWEIEPISSPFLMCHPSLVLTPKRPRFPQYSDPLLCGGNEDLQSVISGIGMEHWIRLQQQSDATPALQMDNYRALAAASFQEIRSEDPSKQLAKQSASLPALQFQQLQFGTPQQLQQQQYHQQLQLPQINIPPPQHPLPFQQSLLPLPPQSPKLQQQQFAPPNVPILLQPLLNTQLPSTDAHMHLRASLVEPDPPAPVLNSPLYSIPNVLPRTSKRVGLPEDSDLFGSMLRSYQNSLQRRVGPLNVASSLTPPQDPQSQSGWFPSTGEENPSESQAVLGPPIITRDAVVSPHVAFSHSIGEVSSQANIGSSGSPSDLHPSSSITLVDGNGYLQSPVWPQSHLPSTRTFTKVYKLGSVGRSLDLTCFKSYEDLRRELESMFGLEGLLSHPQPSGWQLVFVDNENDMLLVGDDPWEEFVNCVRVIKILSPSEVFQLKQQGMEWLDNIPILVQSSSNSEEYKVQHHGSLTQESANLLGSYAH